jgi:lipopolysaccharide transport system ATP-binding protein
MTCDNVILVENFGKKYRIGSIQPRYHTLRDTLAEMVLKPVRGAQSLLHRNGAPRKATDEIIWALRGVSFEIKCGEVVGVIGRNGAGKSTLLKLLSRITEPSEGYAEIRGRVGSLLEVGTGFHPELTGRENIFLNGSILGMRRAEIDSKFDEIVAFAEVEQFLDTQVKHYSSGMQMKLAFAVAAHLHPEILVIDEVLAVGDAVFQKKCLGKMGEVARQGRTVLFVSHNMSALQTLCSRAIWLRSGGVVEDGEATKVVSNYLKQSAGPSSESVWNDMDTAPGNDKVRLHRVRVIPRDDYDSTNITVRTPLDFEFWYWNLVPDAQLNISFFLYNLEEVCIFNVVSESEPRPAGLIRQVCHVPGDLLNDGSYYIRLLIVRDTSVPILSHPNVGSFEVHDVERQGAWFGKWPGAVRPWFIWESEVGIAERAITREAPPVEMIAETR